MPAEVRRRLVADFGGTNVRVAVATVSGHAVDLGEVMLAATREISDPIAYLADCHRRAGAPPLAAVNVAVAGPVDGQGAQARAALTNARLSFSAAALAEHFPDAQVALVNDFAAVAAATPMLAAGDLQTHDATWTDSGPALVIGPGTGLGVAAWLPGGVIVAGEGGHARLAVPEPAAEAAWRALAHRFGFVSAEHVLSGQGFANLHRALAGDATTLLEPAAIWRRHLEGEPAASEAVRLLTLALGAYAGDLALIFGAARVLIAGGIVLQWGAGFDTALFRQAFAAKEPSYLARLQAIPSATIVHPYPALLGLAAS